MIMNNCSRKAKLQMFTKSNLTLINWKNLARLVSKNPNSMKDLLDLIHPLSNRNNEKYSYQIQNLNKKPFT